MKCTIFVLLISISTYGQSGKLASQNQTPDNEIITADMVVEGSEPELDVDAVILTIEGSAKQSFQFSSMGNVPPLTDDVFITPP